MDGEDMHGLFVRFGGDRTAWTDLTHEQKQAWRMLSNELATIADNMVDHYELEYEYDRGYEQGVEDEREVQNVKAEAKRQADQHDVR